MVAGFDLFRPLLTGLIAAAAIVLVGWVAAMIRTRGKTLPFAAIDAGTAWSPSDSWVTNLAAVASLATATWTQLSTGTPPLVPSKAAPAIMILFISFAAAAGLAPVIYASCAIQTNNDQTKNKGTIVGYVLAAFATLFAVGGEMTALGMFAAKAMPTGPARYVLIGSLIAGAVFVALYSLRTMYNVMTVDIGGLKAPAANSARSLLVPAARRSATL